MSLLPTGSYANPTQPLWVPFGGGGGGGGYPADASFNSVTVNASGLLNLSNDAGFNGANVNFFRAPDGTNAAVMAMLWEPGTTAPFNDPAKLALTIAATTNKFDRLIVGEVCAAGRNTYGMVSDCLNLSETGMTYGPPESPNFFLFTVGPSNSWDIDKLNSINGKQLAQAGFGETVGSSTTINLPFPYVDTSYAVVVTPFTAATMYASPISTSNFDVTTSGSNTQFSWIAMPYT